MTAVSSDSYASHYSNCQCELSRFGSRQSVRCPDRVLLNGYCGVLTFICLRRTLLFKVAYRIVTLASRASVTLTRMRVTLTSRASVTITRMRVTLTSRASVTLTRMRAHYVVGENGVYLALF
jgi:hypothetical protein